MTDQQSITTPPPTRLTRRRLMARAGLAGAAAALGTGLLDAGGSRRANSADAALSVKFGPNTTEKKKFAVTDLDILQFALNTEYVEAEFYLRAVNGTGLPDAVIAGVGGFGASAKKAVTPGAATVYVSGTTTGATTTAGNTVVPFTDVYVQQFAQEIALDELAHVTTLRAALGKQAPARPAIDLAGAFTAAMTGAGVIAAGATFDPFASQANFLLAAFFLNDIGPTAYVGATPYLTKLADLQTAAGILGVEAYHAGETRALVFAQGQTDATLLANANLIAALRNTTAALSGSPAVNDQGVTGTSGVANIVPADADAIVFPRGFPALLSLFYLNTKATLAPAPGGFVPAGFNGRIR